MYRHYLTFVHNKDRNSKICQVPAGAAVSAVQRVRYLVVAHILETESMPVCVQLQWQLKSYRRAA